MALPWATIASIVYFGSYAILMFALSIHLYFKNDLKKKSFIITLWKKRSIYSAVLVHLYDTATDFGVIISWWILANDEHDYGTVNMYIFVWCSISFLILYRIFMMIIVVYDEWR
eukprot:506196_1